MKLTAILLAMMWVYAGLFLGPDIDNYNHTFLAEHSLTDRPLIVRLMGEGASIISNVSLLQADLYLHGGVGHFEEEHKEGMAILGGEHAEKEHHEHAEGVPPAKYDFLIRLYDQLHVSEHAHLQGDKIKEIVPWLYYATRIDPHNELAYTLAFYWVADVFGREEEGLNFLRQGLAKNPDSWEINAELGRFYFSKEEYETAERYLSRAARLLKTAQHDKFQERYVLSYLAFTYENLGMKDKALFLYKHLHQLFPKSEVFQKKLGIR